MSVLCRFKARCRLNEGWVPVRYLTDLQTRVPRRSMSDTEQIPGGASLARDRVSQPQPPIGVHAGFVLAQGRPAELNLSPKIFIDLIYCKYGAHEHLGGAFANFGSQVGFLCSDCAESDRIDYYALTSDHVRLMAHACVPSSSIAPASRRFQPQVH